MNFLSAVRLLTEFSLSCLLLVLLSFQCTSKSNKPRKIAKTRAQVVSRHEKKPITPAPNSDPVVTPKPSNEEAAQNPKEHKEVTAPTGPVVVKSNRKKNKTKTETVTQEIGLDATQETQHLPASVTLNVCTTQEDDPAQAAPSTAKPAKPKKAEEFFEDQNDDDTLACVKSIEN